MPFQIDLGPVKANALRYSAPRCNLCGLYRHCKSPKMKVSGFGKKKILITGEAPGQTEDDQGKQFVGRAGQFLEECLDELKINLRKDCWLTNSIICRPKDNRTPTSEEIGYCYPNLSKTIKELQPDVIITVGRPAIESALIGIWQEDLGPMGRWVGWQIPSIDFNSWICPTYHPSFVLREMNANKSGSPIKALFMNHLEAAINLKGKPYKVVPNYKDQVEIILDPKAAAKILDKFRRSVKPIAFDFETNTLKPDKDGKIISASVCNGERTIAFPWYSNELMVAWHKLMKSDCPKIGHNLKFETRWTGRQKIPGTDKFMEVRNSQFCTMIGAHILDNRKGVCSLSFQTLIHLGLGDYSSHISQFLIEKNSYKPNKIKNIELNQLLVYNGLDSLCTYLLAKKQMEKLNYDKCHL